MNLNYWKGMILGLAVPIVALYFYTTLVLKSDFTAGIHQLVQDHLLTQVIAINILANIFPLYVYNRRGENAQMKGVVSASIFYAFIISVLYFINY